MAPFQARSFGSRRSSGCRSRLWRRWGSRSGERAPVVFAIDQVSIGAMAVPAVAEMLLLNGKGDDVRPEGGEGLAGWVAHARIDDAVAVLPVAKRARQRLRGRIVI